MQSSSSFLDVEPATPAGYRPGYFVYHPPAIVNIASTVVFILTLPILIIITLGLQGDLALPIEVSWDIVTIVVMFGASITTLCLHELIHGLVLRYYKYDVSYGMDAGRLLAYAAAFGQFQERTHALTVALAPLTFISISMLPLLALRNHYLVIIAFSMLLTNTSGSVGDLHLAWRLLRLPRKTLLYDRDPTRMLVFLPSYQK